MIGAHHSSAASSGWLVIVARWLAALIVLGLLFHFLPFAPLRAALARIPLTRFLAVLIGYLLAHALGIAKWRMVVNTPAPQLDSATSPQSYTAGPFDPLFLPP